MDRIPEIALDWHRSGKGAALATVVRTWGSAPRRVGSQLVISGAGEIEGSVSGGCVEGAVIVEALDLLEEGTSKILTFGVSDDEAFAVGLACGGEISILVEPVGAAIPEALLSDLVAAREARTPVAYVVNTTDWTRRVDYQSHEERFRMDRSGFDEDVFVAIHNPPLRMGIVGAVHITQPLVQMARMAGYDPFIIDPREVFGSEARFPGEALSNDWPDEALTAWGIDARTAIVTLSHDPKIDDPALHVALKSDAFYIGALGSTRTHAKRVARLSEAGFTEADMARIHSPVGLDIGAASPAEIAVATLAQITAVLRGRA
ncbi:MAG: XdhC family protein [Pseudomonadota bacterium]